MRSLDKILFCWSGGNDSSLALYDIFKSGSHEIVALITTVSRDCDRISMHGVRSCLLDKQAEGLRLPIERMYVSDNCSDGQYEDSMKAVLEKYASMGIKSVGFGDIFLEDLRAYRENNLAKSGLGAVFPLWGKNSSYLARSFIESGFKAVFTCIDSRRLGSEFCGREYDADFLADLPGDVDCCGENGEFHTFVYDAPFFQEAIPFEKGEIILRDKYFFLCDLLPFQPSVRC